MIQIVNTFFHIVHMLYLPRVLSDMILLSSALYDILHTAAAMEQFFTGLAFIAIMPGFTVYATTEERFLGQLEEYRYMYAEIIW